MDKNLIERCNAYPNIEQCSIQTFCDDNKQDRSDSRIMKMSRENLKWCEDLQKRKHYGVFFSVNPMNEWKRSKEDVKFIQTWICDIDTWTKEEQLELIEKAPLQPSLVVESVHWFHLYYLAKKKLTEEEYTAWNMWLMNYYHWDIKVVKDTARVLRLPWFMHCKGKPTKILYRYDMGVWEHYTCEQMLLAFPFQDEKKAEPIQQPIKKIEKAWDWSDSYREKVNQLDNKQMLYELSGTRFVDYQVISFKPCSTWEQIYCDWKETSCRIDHQWMIGSSDNGWPTWIQRIRRYAKQRWQEIDFWDLAKWLNANHPELENKKKFKLEEIEQVEIVWDIKGYVYPSSVFDSFECFTSWELVTIVAESNSWKTTFAMDLIYKNSSLWRKGLYINLEFNVENVWKNNRLRMSGKTKRDMTDLNPMTPTEKQTMKKYIETMMSKYDSISRPSWIDLSDLEELIYTKSKEWYELFIVDSFSRIHGNLDWKNARGFQNKCMEELQELVQKLNVAIVLLHHTNKNWTFEWTQKIMDLSNVFILIQKEENEYWEEYRKYTLSKDKFVSNKTVNAVYRKWEYELI